ncbi:MAG: hypothetical protein HYU84_13165 [Chloroflexi bacterium]|nr:hypothetical protein [Chloroflexota bacterium]MBI3170439.1 hypothetical protein [Chloroflexota bacterium]
MNHQPFETWLLDDKALNLTEKRELDSHLRECKTCSALAETGLALRSARVVSPARGFAMRFQQKLAAQKLAEQRRRLWGLIVLVVSGVGLLGWLLAPVLISIANSPVEWLVSAAGIFLFVFTSLQAFGEIVSVMLRVLPDFLPPYMWMVILSGLAGMGLLWAVSIWRLSRRLQGVPA